MVDDDDDREGKLELEADEPGDEASGRDEPSGRILPSGKKDHFPETLTIIKNLAERDDPEERRVLNNRLMSLYYEPLMIYYRGTGFYSRDRLGEPEEIVSGFFENRLGREDFLKKWRASELPLRRWLMNGLIFYLRERKNPPRREAAFGGDEYQPEVVDDDALPPAKELDRAYARQIAMEALRLTQETCEETGYAQHWEAFALHFLQRMKFPLVSKQLGIPTERARAMARTGKNRFARIARQLVARDLNDTSKLSEEFRSILGSLHS